MHINNKLKSLASYPLILTITSFVALVSSIWQASERVNMLKNPGLDLSCNLNPIIDCGTVMSHKLSSLFGFPNAFIGISMFSMLFASGLLMMAGVKFTKTSHKIVLALSIIAVLFSLWFFGVSLYVIGKACIFCLFIWPSSVIMFWESLQIWLGTYCDKNSFAIKLIKLRVEILVMFIVILALLFMYRFRDYYFS